MIRIRQLKNGVRVATDAMQGVRSCSLGIWLEAGSALERPGEYGLAHFIEHMLFKGTRRLTALELADELNRLGGNVNAATSQEGLCLHAQCVDHKAPRVLDCLAEMMLESTFPREEIRRERNVILEEYKMIEDSPEEMVVEHFFGNLWPKSPLGRPVIGLPTTIRRISSRSIERFREREFVPSRILIVLAGRFDARECSRIIDRKFGPLAARTAAARPRETRSQQGPRMGGREREVEQVHFCFGGPAPSRASRERFAFAMLNMILGGGMSSRLFKEVREKRGLVYSIQSFTQSFRNRGAFAIVGATSPETLEAVLAICRCEIEDLRRRAVDPDELEIAREQVLDALLLSVESTGSRVGRLADAILTFGRPIPIEEVVRRLKAVTPSHVRGAARRYLRPGDFAGALIGPPGHAAPRQLRKALHAR